MNMTTMQMLAMQYGFRALIPLDMIANDKADKLLLSRGFIHRSKENAIAHAKALIQLSRGTINAE